MARSLQDQLLETGLVTEEQLARARRERGPDRRRGGKRRDAGKAPGRARKRTQAPPARAPVERAPAPSDEARRAQSRARIRDLVLARQQNAQNADLPYNFVRGARVKRVYVTAPQQRDLAAGRLAVTVAKGRHWLVPVEIAEEILRIDPGHFVHRVDPVAPAAPEGGDEYAGYEVPDDLMW